MSEPGVLPDPYPVSVVVRQGNAEEKFLQTDPHASKSFWETVSGCFDTDAINLEEFEEGTELATVHVEFQRDDFPYDPHIKTITLAPGEPLPLNSRLAEMAESQKQN